MFNTLIYKISSSKYLRYFFIFTAISLLCGCDKEGAFGGDKNYEVQASCWQTKIISAVLRIIDSLYRQSSNYVTQDAMASGGAGIIAIGFAIWVAFKLIKTLSSFKEENLGEVWTEIGQKLFVCGFCMYIVYNPENISWAIKTFILPIYNTILELGLRILKASSYSSSHELGEYGVLSYKYNYSMCEVREVMSGTTLQIKDAITPMAECLVCSISDRLNVGIKIGISLIGTLNVAGILVGLIVLFLFTAAKYSFVFFIIDSLFRLNFAVFLLPIFIIGIPFNYTRKWSKHCFLMFLNSAGVMMFLGLLVVIAISALEAIVNTIGNEFKEEYFLGFGPMMLSILFIAFLLVNIPGMGVALADKFIGGGGGDEFQKKISKFVMTAAKKMGAAVLGGATSGVSQVVTDLADKYEVTREAVSTAKHVQQNISSKLNQLAGYDDDK